MVNQRWQYLLGKHPKVLLLMMVVFSPLIFLLRLSYLYYQELPGRWLKRLISATVVILILIYLNSLKSHVFYLLDGGGFVMYLLLCYYNDMYET
ncbi:hypothetical protein [Eremococcus coleocola]|uniref:hypothetical protein n=1 Tax=Eremococcus coleocola TaxID=88132 RepID=UPI00138AD6AC|nr:hypothetical protein [Eremococcus coleocola]